MPNDFNARIIEEFRANDGKVGEPFADRTMVLLTTTGAKSGQPRTVPLVTVPHNDRYLLVASKGGAPTHPDWYWNLRANPSATIELGSRTKETTLVELTGSERDTAFNHVAKLMPGFADYQANTSRVIPVFTFSVD